MFCDVNNWEELTPGSTSIWLHCGGASGSRVQASACQAAARALRRARPDPERARPGRSLGRGAQQPMFFFPKTHGMRITRS